MVAFLGYHVIFQAIYETSGRNLTQQIGIDRMAYSSVALLHAAAERLQMPELESRLLRRLETMTPRGSELAYLLSSVSTSDISIQIFINDLARRYHHAWLDDDMQTLRDVGRLVEQQDSASFQRMFAKEIDRRRCSPPCECRTTYWCGNEACCLHRWAKKMNRDGSCPRHHPDARRQGHEFERYAPAPKRAHHNPDFPAPPRSPTSSFTSDDSHASTSSTTSSSYDRDSLHAEPQRSDDSTRKCSRQTSTTITRTTSSTTAIRNRRWSSSPPASPQGSPNGRFAVDYYSKSGV